MPLRKVLCSVVSKVELQQIARVIIVCKSGGGTYQSAWSIETVIRHCVLRSTSEQKGSDVVFSEIPLIVEGSVGIEIAHAAPGTGCIAVCTYSSSEELKFIRIGQAAPYGVLRDGIRLYCHLAVIFLIAYAGLEIKSLQKIGHIVTQAHRHIHACAGSRSDRSVEKSGKPASRHLIVSPFAQSFLN